MTPVFATYLSIALKDLIDQQGAIGLQSNQMLSNGFRWVTFIVFGIYALLLFIIIGLKPQGVLAFEELQNWLAGVESGFGIYIGQIIYALFRKSNKQ